VHSFNNFLETCLKKIAYYTCMAYPRQTGTKDSIGGRLYGVKIVDTRLLYA